MAIDQNISSCSLGISNWIMISTLHFSGSALKKELTAVTNLPLELPQKNPLRTNLERYKKRIEEYLDEFLGLTFQFFEFSSFKSSFLNINQYNKLYPKIQVNHCTNIFLRMKSLKTAADISDMKTEVEEEA